PYRSLILIPQLIRQPSKGQYCRRYYIICRVESQEISVNSAAGRAPTAIKASMCLDIQLFAVDLIGIEGSTRLRPCHTTRHGGPLRAIREVEVMRVQGSLKHQSSRL